MTNNDTIVAQATAIGRGGVGIIRVSGNQTKRIAEQILGEKLKPRYATLLPFKDNQQQVIDKGIAIFFPKPNSFTGEDVLELQGHGGPVVLDMLLKNILEKGARIAKPGEFSERAFLNDKMDLLQAEAIADLINASSEQAARSAINSLQGAFSEAVNALIDGLKALRMYVEAAIDFPEEEIDFLSEGKVEEKLEQLMEHLQYLLRQAKQGAMIKEGINVVIAGKPNAGKSSLLNKLTQKETAIVTQVPGTTRDVLKEHIMLEGLPIHVIDTAGLRESDNEVEKIGISRAWKEIKQADLLLFVQDASEEAEVEKTIDELWQQITHEQRPPIPAILVKNKIDQLSKEARLRLQKEAQQKAEVAISIKKDLGIQLLIEKIKKTVGFTQTEQGAFLARRRHLNALEKAQKALEKGQQQIQIYHAGELLAEELRLAQNVLSEITGAFSADDLLGEIFSSFCIGK